MPLIDMPLEKLKLYKGITPKPKDFDKFWDRSLKDMRAEEPEIELIPATFKAPFADCFDLFFTGAGDGSRIHAKLLIPKKPKGRLPAIVEFHGYSGDAGAWVDKLPYVAAGFVFAALDCRGQGGLSEDRGAVKGNTLYGHIIRGLDEKDPAKMLFRNIFLDCARLADIVSGLNCVDPGRLGAMGGSQGGALTVACAGLVPQIKMAAPAFPFLSDYRRIWEMDLAKDAYGDLKDYFRHFDPTHEHEDEIFMRLGYIDIQNLAPRIKAEVLWGLGLVDTICPPSTQFAAYNKIKSKKRMEIYHDFGHEGLPGFNDKRFEFLMKLR